MIAPNRCHSAEVELWLHCDGKRYELGQVGGDIILLKRPEPISAGEALIETIINGQSDRFPIGVIPDQPGESRRITFAPSST
ncbi:hypothetical protein [Neorhodopirellula pilleata]|uniref:Uncharacterized protein n=1 Tax=Neorhodopirellula pilleata TaxID=2714738 RepID=A0A5C5YUU9_9BACT|nr:hypothetical protein [Neorhodopirellula pilleata]TWT78600.1 hypothetical protein Pla100_62920 [Neorhodopirellula pilleata]